MKSFTTRMLTLILLSLIFAPAAWAQVTGGEWSVRSEFVADGGASEFFGREIAGGEDVDGDGCDDFLVSDPLGSCPAPGGSGCVALVSGKDASVLHTFAGSNGVQNLGTACALVPDVTGDGVPDVFLGAVDSSPGRALLYSGADYTLVHEFGVGDPDATKFFGWDVGVIGDIDGDQIPDLFVQDREVENPSGVRIGSVRAYSGADYSHIRDFLGDINVRAFENVLASGDLTGDGVPDIVTTDSLHDAQRRNHGAIRIFSGADASVFGTLIGDDIDYFLGSAVAMVPDQDGDGVRDLAATDSSDGDFGRFGIYSTATGGRLHWIFDGSSFPSLAEALVTMDDVNGDGVDDLAAGGTSSNAFDATGTVRIYSGVDLSPLHVWEGLDVDGYSLAASLNQMVSGGDTDADGLGDLLVLRRGAVDPDQVAVFHLDPYLEEGPTELSLGGAHVPLAIDFPDSESGQRYAVLLSLGTGPSSLFGVDVPLTTDALFLKGIQGRTPGLVVDAYGVLDANGDALASLSPVPALAGLVDTTFYVAVVSYDPAGPAPRLSSIAKAVTIAP